MFKKAVLFLGLLVLSQAAPKTSRKLQANGCNESVCKPPDCRCYSTSIPGGLDPSETPQFVFLTFDDAISNLFYNDYYTKAFSDRTNPDGCDISVTYFMSHDYTDYGKAHDLYVQGHEIALHSISHSTNTTYWQHISVEDLVREFDGERTIITHFANIPEEDIKGMRLPFLQLSGDNSFDALEKIGLKYDCSWPTHDPPFWPYTLDYPSPQNCPIGPCPKNSHPGAWEVPMIDWRDQEDVVCDMVDGCVNIPTDVDELVDWFKDNFNVHYNGNKAPFGFYVHAAWFQRDERHFEAYVKFLDYLQSLNDVYIVNISKGLEWIQNPLPFTSDDWNTCNDHEDLGCRPLTCHLKNAEDSDRYMTQCLRTCPANYPWIDNPLGE